jgi:hypothetical protein
MGGLIMTLLYSYYSHIIQEIYCYRNGMFNSDQWSLDVLQKPGSGLSRWPV